MGPCLCQYSYYVAPYGHSIDDCLENTSISMDERIKALEMYNWF